jgi:circadian clock protein KaiB
MKVPKKKKRADENEFEAFARAAKRSRARHYLLRLYITGTTPKSMRAIANIRKICDEHLKGRYELEVVDIYQQQELAKSANILAAPTLIKRLPLPLRKMIGDMANTDRILVGLDLRPKE